MSQKATTKDELFLIKLHEMAMAQLDLQREIDQYVIGRAIGQNDKGVNTIVNLLAQANFVKKCGDNLVHITSNGVRLVEHLLVERVSPLKTN